MFLDWRNSRTSIALAFYCDCRNKIPRWLIGKGRLAEAEAVVMRWDGSRSGRPARLTPDMNCRPGRTLAGAGCRPRRGCAAKRTRNCCRLMPLARPHVERLGVYGLRLSELDTTASTNWMPTR